ncbi:MAG: DNA-binding response regulator [Bacteroidetes bacterium GWF2_41_31]|nr:MAG: DNA-binding response regulator [Bacteroidetes bacterium GWF2_41_31]
MKTIAIDDEPLALSLVTDYIKKTGFLTLSGTFDNPLDAMDFLGNESVDLIFLDIQMPDLTGIEFIKTLPDPPKIIFTTAYEKYALEGFKVNAVDYLLKPFSYQEFLTAVQKARKIIELERNVASTSDSGNQFLFLKSDYKIRKINFADILYIEGLKDYVKVYVGLGEPPILSINTIKSLEQKLPPNQFMRVHRSFIVNLQKIETIERSRIVFGKNYIPVSDQYKAVFHDFVNKNFL